MVSIHFRDLSLSLQFKTYIYIDKVPCCPGSYPHTWSASRATTHQLKISSVTENSSFICGLDKAIQNTLVQTTMLKFTAELLEWVLLTQEKT